MNIVYVSAEAVPFAKVGGLGDVIGSLPPEITKRGHNCSICMPYYSSIKGTFELFHTINNEAAIYKTKIKNTDCFLFKTAGLFRDNIYGSDEEDEALKFTQFSRMVLQFINEKLPKTDIIHCNDWHTAAIPIYLKESDSRIKSVFTIHNLAFQGIISYELFKQINISRNNISFNNLEYYGKINLMKGAIVYSDAVTTVSNTYAEEILHKEYGFGLEGVLTQNKYKLKGILNGLDNDHFNPATDPAIHSNYLYSDMSGKENCNKALCLESGFDYESKRPIMGFVSRLTEQKGIDIIVKAFDEIIESGIDLVMLGNGTNEVEELMREFEKKHEGRFKLFTRFDLSLAQRIYSGSDFYLMPSRFEPCGLSQLIAMRYGSLPIARMVGGLKDTISDQVNGFLFRDYSADALIESVKKAVSVYNDKAKYSKMVSHAMNADFSWYCSAKEYEALYRGI